MDLSKLSRNENLAALGGAMAVVGGLVAAATYSTYGLAWLGVLAGIAMLGIVLQPQLWPKTALPGSRGSLMVLVGGIAAAVMVLGLLSTLAFTFFRFGIADLLFLVAVAGAGLMAYAAWLELQAEGGKLRIGSGSAPAAPSSEPTDAADAPSSSGRDDEPGGDEAR